MARWGSARKRNSTPDLIKILGSPEIKVTDESGIERIAADTEVFFVLLQTFASPAHAVVRPPYGRQSKTRRR